MYHFPGLHFFRNAELATTEWPPAINPSRVIWKRKKAPDQIVSTEEAFTLTSGQFWRVLVATLCLSDHLGVFFARYMIRDCRVL